MIRRKASGRETKPTPRDLSCKAIILAVGLLVAGNAFAQARPEELQFDSPDLSMLSCGEERREITALENLVSAQKGKLELLEGKLEELEQEIAESKKATP